MLYAKCVVLAKDVAYLLNPPLLKQQGHIQKKAKSYELKALNKTMLPMRRNKSITISHTQHKTTAIPTKEKEWGREKKGRPIPGVIKSNQKKKKKAN